MNKALIYNLIGAAVIAALFIGGERLKASYNVTVDTQTGNHADPNYPDMTRVLEGYVEGPVCQYVNYSYVNATDQTRTTFTATCTDCDYWRERCAKQEAIIREIAPRYGRRKRHRELYKRMMDAIDKKEGD